MALVSYTEKKYVLSYSECICDGWPYYTAYSIVTNLLLIGWVTHSQVSLSRHFGLILILMSKSSLHCTCIIHPETMKHTKELHWSMTLLFPAGLHLDTHCHQLML
jgi:hypothetical protein